MGSGPDSTILCEPSLARKTTRPPDVVFIDPLAGIHVLEVKGVTLDQIEALELGGASAFVMTTVFAHATQSPRCEQQCSTSKMRWSVASPAISYCRSNIGS